MVIAMQQNLCNIFFYNQTAIFIRRNLQIIQLCKGSDFVLESRLHSRMDMKMKWHVEDPRVFCVG